MKRKLLPAVMELEARGFLSPLPDADRFVKVLQGNWKAVFVKATKKLAVIPQEGDDSLARELVARGITPRSARKLLSQHSASRIEEKLRLFDGLKARGGEGAIRNRAGWLYSAIVNDYTGDDVPPAQLAHPRPSATPPTPVRAKPEPGDDTQKPEAIAFEAFWASLDDDARRTFEEAAVAAAPPFLQKQLQEGSEMKGSLWRITRQRILLSHHVASTTNG